MDDENINFNNKGTPKVPLVLSFIIMLFLAVYLSKYFEWQKSPFRTNNINANIINEITDLEDLPNNGSQSIDNGIAKTIYSKYDFTRVQNYYGDSFKDIYFANKSISDEYMIYLALLNILEDDFSKECKIEKSFPEYDIKAKVFELFGGKPYNNVSFELDGLKVTFENDIYKVVTSKCSTLDFMSDRIDTEYASNQVVDGRLVITVYGYLVTFDDGMYNYYKDITHNSEILGHDIATIDKKNFTKYTLVFVKNANDDYFLEGFGKA